MRPVTEAKILLLLIGSQGRMLEQNAADSNVVELTAAGAQQSLAEHHCARLLHHLGDRSDQLCEANRAAVCRRR